MGEVKKDLKKFWEKVARPLVIVALVLVIGGQMLAPHDRCRSFGFDKAQFHGSGHAYFYMCRADELRVPLYELERRPEPDWVPVAVGAVVLFGVWKIYTEIKAETKKSKKRWTPPPQDVA